MALNAAHSGQVRDALDQYGALSSGIYDVRVPDGWLGEEGAAGVLLGLDDPSGGGVPRQLSLPLEDIPVVNVKLLTQAELAHVVRDGAAGRESLARVF